MQTTAEGFTAEERDSVRKIAHNLLVSWKKDTNLAATTFTIGVSTIGGDDLIGINAGAIGSPSNYLYFDESDYVMSLSWERGLNMPVGGLSKAMGEALIDNTSGRFTPRYMGGTSELFTAILPRRPFIINSGFNYNGIDQVIPQLTGVTTRQLSIDQRSKNVRLQGADWIDFFQNRYLDQTTMFTTQTTDVVIESLLSQLGMSTAQYDLDAGINVIPFGLFEKGQKFSEIIGKLVEAENGHFYQDEQGKFKFENRQHWDLSPYNQVQKIILTGQVINSGLPNTDHIVNVVEIKSKVRVKQPEQVVYKSAILDNVLLLGNSTTEFWVEFTDPVLSLTTPSTSGRSYYRANTQNTGSGTDLTSKISITKVERFATTAKLTFYNSGSSNAYLTELVITGRPAKHTRDIYVRSKDDSSVTAYEDRPLLLENDYISSEDWANSLSQMILNDFAEPENLQKVTVKAMPSLQLGDLISWQGRHWRIFNIRSQLDPSVGYIQELILLQRTIQSYFRIGISTIGGSDLIAP